MSASTSVSTQGIARKFIASGLSFVILIALASYSASLTSHLVVQRKDVGSIQGMAQAIEQNVAICVPVVISKTIRQRFPAANLVNVLVSSDGVRQMYSGECGAFVLGSTEMQDLHAGYFHTSDCEAVAAGGDESEHHCKEGFPGRTRNDCELMRVGDMLSTLPVGFPVSSRLSKSLSWATIQALNDGKLEDMFKLHESLLPQSRCGETAAETVSEGMVVEELAGVFMIGSVLMCVGCLVFLGQVLLHAVRGSTTSCSTEAQSA